MGHNIRVSRLVTLYEVWKVTNIAGRTQLHEHKPHYYIPSREAKYVPPRCCSLKGHLGSRSCSVCNWRTFLCPAVAPVGLSSVKHSRVLSNIFPTATTLLFVVLWMQRKYVTRPNDGPHWESYRIQLFVLTAWVPGISLMSSWFMYSNAKQEKKLSGPASQTLSAKCSRSCVLAVMYLSAYIIGIR